MTAGVKGNVARIEWMRKSLRPVSLREGGVIWALNNALVQQTLQ